MVKAPQVFGPSEPLPSIVFPNQNMVYHVCKYCGDGGRIQETCEQCCGRAMIRSPCHVCNGPEYKLKADYIERTKCNECESCHRCGNNRFILMLCQSCLGNSQRKGQYCTCTFGQMQRYRDTGAELPFYVKYGITVGMKFPVHWKISQPTDAAEDSSLATEMEQFHLDQIPNLPSMQRPTSSSANPIVFGALMPPMYGNQKLREKRIEDTSPATQYALASKKMNQNMANTITRRAKASKRQSRLKSTNSSVKMSHKQPEQQRRIDSTPRRMNRK
jgi:hypothetical protein